MHGYGQMAKQDTIKMVNDLVENMEAMLASLKHQRAVLLEEFRKEDDGPLNLLKAIMKMAVTINNFKPDISAMMSAAVNVSVTGGLVFMPIGSDKEISELII
jgi:hypothetical protein